MRSWLSPKVSGARQDFEYVRSAPGAPDQDQPYEGKRGAIIRPLRLPDHEARPRPVDRACPLADPKQADEQGEDAEGEKRIFHARNMHRLAGWAKVSCAVPTLQNL